VFVMANSRLPKQKDVRKTKDYNIEDLASDDGWNVEENEANSSFDVSDEDILVKVGEDEDASRGGVVAPMNDLEVPPIIMVKVKEKMTLMKTKIMWRRTMIILHLMRDFLW